jgi:SOS-response transcriptional repressor LexA
MRTIGQRHSTLCRFIQQYTQTHGWPPSRREMAAALGSPSTSLVAYYLEALEQHGYVSCQPAISRGLVLTPAGQALAEHA